MPVDPRPVVPGDPDRRVDGGVDGGGGGVSRGRALRAVRVEPGAAGVRALLEVLPDALAGRGDAIAPLPTVGGPDYLASLARAVRAGDGAEPLESPEIAVVLTTSGSTGQPRGVLLSAEALLAAVEGSAAMPALGAPAGWLIALPVTSAGGFMAALRGLLAGVCAPVTLPSIGGGGPFEPGEFVRATRDLAGAAGAAGMLTSLVPAQVARLLDDPAATAALASYRAILVGGSRTPAALVERAAGLGIALVPTYGMTETAGGFAYDGVPFPGVEVSADAGGHLLVRGPVVAHGYRLRPQETAERFTVEGGVRSFRTGDVGFVLDGRVVVTGRTDDVVTVRGTNVALGAVEDVVRSVPGVRDVAVVAVPDPVDGVRIVACVVGAVGDDLGGMGGAEGLIDGVRAAVRERLGVAAVPGVIRGVASLPLLPNGKIDRRAVAEVGGRGADTAPERE